MNFKYAENQKCSCGVKAVYEISDDKNAMYFCQSCMTQIAAGFFGLRDMANKVESTEAKDKPNNLFKDIGDISFERDGKQITVDPFICSDYSPTIYFRNTKKYVAFSWDNLLNIAVNLGAAKK